MSLGMVRSIPVQATGVAGRFADCRTSRGRGATRRDGSRGDLLVSIDVAVPHKVSGKAKEALEAYRAATVSENPRAHLPVGD